MLKHRALLLASLITLSSSVALAQDDSGKGLDSLSDDRLLTDLARRNVKSLLNRALEINKTPSSKKDAILASGALNRLQNDETITLVERRRLVADYIKAAPELMKQIRDPQSLMADASVLIDHGVLTDQRLLEYFGSNSTVMNRLKPVVETVSKMLLRSRELSDEAASKAQQNWPAGKAAWERADNQATIAEYTRNILAYSAALAMDRSNDERERLLQSASEYLDGFDNEENPNRADLKFYLGKINMERTGPEALENARQCFAYTIMKGAQDNIGQQFEARFFVVVTELNARASDPALKSLQSLEEWSRQKKLIDQPETIAAISALKYRVQVLRADQAKSPADKEIALQTADDILDKLQQSQPGLRGLIMELLGARAGSGVSIDKLNNLMLQSLRTKAEAEAIKPEGTAFDSSVIQRGLQSAQEIIRRGGADNSAAINDSKYVLGFFYQKLGNPVQAAATFLEYVDQYKTTDKDRAEIAFNNAVSIVGGLNRTQFGDPEVTRMYDHVLELAVKPPFEKKEFAFEYARRLQAVGKIDEAIAIYSTITSDRKEYNDSRYFLMVAVHDKLGELRSDDPARQRLQEQIQSLANDVNLAFTPIPAGADERTLLTRRVRLSQTRLLAADVALRDQKNPKRAIEMLSGFEETVAGLPNEADLMGEVLLIRVQSYVQDNHVNEATAELVRLAEKRPQQAGQIVYNLLEKLDQQVTAAEAAGRKDEVGQLERNRAALTPFYVKWIQENANPELKKHAYSAAVFDADTQRRAAELTSDLPKRSELLQAALQRFQQLDTPDHLQQFLAVQTSDKRKQLKYDPQVKLGLARVAFAQGDYKSARIPLAMLFRDKVLGDGITLKTDAAGDVEQVDNPTYWEAMYRLIRCNVSLADNVEGMKQWLRDQYAVYRDEIGGPRWSAEFKELIRELDIQPPPTTIPTP